MLTLSQSIALLSRRRRQRGFSFTEILFAVMILGIGFIMIAAIFPVAIEQTKTSQEESIAAAIVRSATSTVTQMAQTDYLGPSVDAQIPLCVLRPTVPMGKYFGKQSNDTVAWYTTFQDPTQVSPIINASWPTPAPGVTTETMAGQVWAIGDSIILSMTNSNVDRVLQIGSGNNFIQYQQGVQPLYNVAWSMVSQNMIQAANPRYGWVAFYKRDLVATGLGTASVRIGFAPTLQLIVVGVRATNSTNYDSSDLIIGSSTNTIQPSIDQSSSFTIAGPSQFATTISFSDKTIQSKAAEGAFVIIADDSLPANNPLHGALNGHFYRLGGNVTNKGIATASWELAPGYALSSTDINNMVPSSEKFTVYIIGKSQDPTNGNQYGGPPQDIAVYSTFVSCGTN